MCISVADLLCEGICNSLREVSQIHPRIYRHMERHVSINTGDVRRQNSRKPWMMIDGTEPEDPTHLIFTLPPPFLPDPPAMSCKSGSGLWDKEEAHYSLRGDKIPWRISRIGRCNPLYSTRSHSYILQVSFARTTSSFYCEAPQLWNELLIEVVSSTSFTPLIKESMYVSLRWIIHTPPCYVSLLAFVLGAWAHLLPMYLTSCTWTIIEKNN